MAFTTTILVALALMGTVCSTPVTTESKGRCPSRCESTTKYQQLDFQHSTSNLNDTSLAPWKLEYNHSANRLPQSILVAQCKPCTVQGLDVEPITIQIPVIESHGNVKCKCPFELAVGCTCVKKQSQ